MGKSPYILREHSAAHSGTPLARYCAPAALSSATISVALCFSASFSIAYVSAVLPSLSVASKSTPAYNRHSEETEWE